MAYTISSALAMLTRSGASREEIRAAEAIQEVLDIHHRGTLDVSGWSNSPYTVLFDFCEQAMTMTSEDDDNDDRREQVITAAQIAYDALKAAAKRNR